MQRQGQNRKSEEVKLSLRDGGGSSYMALVLMRSVADWRMRKKEVSMISSTG